MGERLHLVMSLQCRNLGKVKPHLILPDVGILICMQELERRSLYTLGGHSWPQAKARKLVGITRLFGMKHTVSTAPTKIY
ncbi:rCG48856 [Rattus norvegicus]|uniref:RCG48856 n=1 Tax=Rattus norvegicus TaxID=10116 RepID=A6IFY3_RAT|nr:rCG48856 [Rattus norvegicus]